MIKKISAVLLAVIMSLVFVACGAKDNNAANESESGNNASQSDSTEPKTEPKTEPAAEFSVGTSANNVYKNEFLGVQCKLGSDWTFKTDAEIQEINKTTLGMVDEDYAEAMKNANTLTDMYAVHSNQTDTINVTFEKLSGQLAKYSEQEYVDASKTQLPDVLGSAGYENIEINTDIIEFAGEQHPCITISCEFNGYNMYETMAVVKQGDYFANITTCTWNENTSAELLKSFSKI